MLRINLAQNGAYFKFIKKGNQPCNASDCLEIDRPQIMGQSRICSNVSVEIHENASG